jgi:hypothetical protein
MQAHISTQLAPCVRQLAKALDYLAQKWTAIVAAKAAEVKQRLGL